MIRAIPVFAVLLAGGLSVSPALAQTLYPRAGAARVNPDVQLKLTFDDAPRIGTTGTVRIYDASDDRLVDTLDLSIPAGPVRPVDAAVRAKGYLAFPYPYERSVRATNADTRPGTPSAGATPTTGEYQLSIIGGFTDGFHFYPVTVYDRTATIHPHNDLLRYGKTYYVQVDADVLSVPNDPFSGISGKRWRFTVKPASAAPRPAARSVTVGADGTGDFDTVQAALDFVPDHAGTRTTIRVRNGLYEEIVYFRNKDKVTVLGEDQAKTIIRYANNETLNPHPANLRSNERPGTFPSRRAAFTVDNSNDVHLVNLTLQTTASGQAEGLLVTGERNLLSHVTVIGAGDALQANGTTYIADSTILGTGDTILGRGAIFCERCTIKSTRVMMWIRNTDTGHGNVFKDSTFIGLDEPTTIARSPGNGAVGYPFAEAVLLGSTLVNIAPEGWGSASPDGNVRFWEYASRNADRSPADISKRAPWSRQLDAVRDAKTIALYSDPAFVLAGWTPHIAADER